MNLARPIIIQYEMFALKINDKYNVFYSKANPSDLFFISRILAQTSLIERHK
jgi:hypothetical protein